LLPRSSEALFEVDAEPADMTSDQGGNKVALRKSLPGEVASSESLPGSEPDEGDLGRLPGVDADDPRRFAR
jgi:hypothetical protein